MLRLLLLAILVTTISSCKVYQVFETDSSKVAKDSGKNFFYENDDVKLIYNFWSKGGDFYFTMLNKTDKPIYIDWAKSNFIKNNIAKDYWKDVTYSVSRTISSTMDDVIILDKGGNSGFFPNATISNTRGKSERPRPNAQIPPHAAVSVSSFNISNYIPYKKNTAHAGKGEELIYDSLSTPLQFRNYVGYTFDKDLDSLKFVDNNFWIKKITIMTEGEFKRKSSDGIQYVHQSPTAFYDYMRDKRRTAIAKGSVVATVLGLTGIGILIGFLSGR